MPKCEVIFARDLRLKGQEVAFLLAAIGVSEKAAKIMTRTSNLERKIILMY